MSNSGFDPNIFLTILTTILGYVMGAFSEKINFNREKRMEIYLERKKLYLDITKMIAIIPSNANDIEKCESYCNKIVAYYDENMAMLLLISNTNIADEFTDYIRMYEKFIKTKDLNCYNDIIDQGQKVITLMRKKLKSED